MGKKRFNDHPFPYHAEIELEITTLTNRGVGLGRLQLDDLPGDEDGPALRGSAKPSEGWVIMVPFTLPGERVRARVFRNHRNYSEADLIEVLTPSEHRIEPRCPIFGTCGGCQYQHLEYSEQLAWKRRQVAELLKHLAGIEYPVDPVVPSPREYGYRSKITPHFRAGGPRNDDAGPQPIGFLRQGTRFDVVDVLECLIATPEINEALVDVRSRVRERLAAGEFSRGATLLLRHAAEGVVTDYDAVIHETVELPPCNGSAERRELQLEFLARDFFQNNPFLLGAFVTHVTSEAAGGGQDLLVDAYCGCGLFALAAAPAFERVAGVELSESSVRFARRNAEANGIANATFRAGDAGAIFAGLDFAPARTAVVIDPPRRGCDATFLAQLLAYRPARVVYVSCDPATQMRDLTQFSSAGYELARVQPFDLFPQTRHLECVMTLVAR